MKHQIKKSLLTLMKISNLPDNPYIDTTDGDIDVYKKGAVNYLKHVVFDGRSKMISLLDKKYEEIGLHIDMIIQCKKHDKYLEMFAKGLESSKAGLKLIKQSEHYKNDMRVYNAIEHLLQVEIPFLIDTAIKTNTN